MDASFLHGIIIITIETRDNLYTDSIVYFCSINNKSGSRTTLLQNKSVHYWNKLPIKILILFTVSFHLEITITLSINWDNTRAIYKSNNIYSLTRSLTHLLSSTSPHGSEFSVVLSFSVNQKAHLLE